MKEKTSDTQNEEKKKDAGALLARALIFLFAAGTAVGAVLCLGNAFDAEKLSLKIVLFVSGPLLAVASGLSWIVFAAALNPVRRNLFLYDRETKSEIPVEELTWERIEDRLAGCFAYYFRSRRLLAAMPPVLNPLFLPFYLLQFREAEDPDVDRLLKNKEMIDAAGLALNTL